MRIDDQMEAALIEAARAGDAGALGELTRRHEGRVQRFARALARDPDEARDVAQDALEAMARGLAGFRGEAALSTWLYALVRNAWHKRRRARPGLEAADDGSAREVADDAPDPEQRLAARAVRREIDRAIDALAPAYRDVLVLRDLDGLSAPEIADTLGLRVGAVRVRLHRARAAVRRRIAPALGLAPPHAEPRAA